MRRRLLAAIFLLVASSLLLGTTTQPQVTPDPVMERVRAHRQAHAHAILRELVQFVSLPNVATNQDDIWRNAERLMELLEGRGIHTEVIPTSGSPVVYGEILQPGATQTILFYAHYDGQAVDPSRWINSQPFAPVLRRGVPDDWSTIPFPTLEQPFDDNWRLYGRSVSDDKGPIVALLAALDALEAQGLRPRVNLKFVFEGEEEQGSPHLGEFIAQEKARLAADVLIVADGPVHQSGRPTVFFGTRGILTFDITVYGPRVSLHSGHYGNWAPNPAMRLAQLLATMKDDEGNVLIEGFYDDVVPLTTGERQALAEVPNLDEELRQRFGIGAAEGGGRRLEEMLQLPSLNVCGLESAWVGEQARTIVPATATATIDVRLVKGNDPARMYQKILAHIRRQGYYVVEADPTPAERQQYARIAKVVKREGYNAVRTPRDLPVAQAVVRAVARGVFRPDIPLASQEVVMLPTLGGSGPFYLFEGLGIASVGVPIVNFDNNQHSPNENLRLGNFWQGIDIFAALMLLK